MVVREKHMVQRYNAAMAVPRRLALIPSVVVELVDVESAVFPLGHNNDGNGMLRKPHRPVHLVVPLCDQLLAAPFPIAGYLVSNPESSPR